MLNNNRHATCVDCHNGHGSAQVAVFPLPPLVRVSQRDTAGISATDGMTVVDPTVNQYENCFRCHGTSSGKAVRPIYGYLPVRAVSAGDPLNIIPQLASTSTSSHPVTHVSNSSLPQPSLLANDVNLNGVTPGRAMGTQIFCTDCHNSDDNREFGGSGADGPPWFKVDPHPGTPLRIQPDVRARDQDCDQKVGDRKPYRGAIV